MPRLPRNPFLRSFVKLFTSLQLTIACLALAMVLIFVGTLAQAQIGIDQATEQYFRSFVVWWSPPGASWRIPIMPGGFTIGGVMLVNLIISHLYRFRLTFRKAGIWITHFGLIVLLLGELFTALFAEESYMSIQEGQTKTYSESHRRIEVVLIDQTDGVTDRVLAIDEDGLEPGASYQHPAMPLRLEVVDFFPNSQLFRKTPETAAFAAPAATRGAGANLTAREIPRTGRQDMRDISVAWIRVVGTDGEIGTWMVSNLFLDPRFNGEPQIFEHDGHTYRIELRQKRTYHPFAITLLDFAHDRYPGTNIPKNFSSHIRLIDPELNQDREVLIYMNHPLRHRGLTFYQHSFEAGDTGTVLQVVRNPSRHLPYISCALVFFGMTLQFVLHLDGFFRRRKSST